MPSASDFPVGCRVTITNSDPLPTGSNSTGAKWITVGGIHGCQPTDWEGTYLYPLQTMEVTVVASDTWQITRCPNLWQIPSGNQFVLNWDPVNGSDRPGVADGLATGSRAFKSANNALDFAGKVMAANISSQFTVKCTYNGGSCTGQSDPLGIHWPPHGGSPNGSQGGSGIILNCNGASLTGTHPMVDFLPRRSSSRPGATSSMALRLRGEHCFWTWVPETIPTALPRAVLFFR